MLFGVLLTGRLSWVLFPLVLFSLDATRIVVTYGRYVSFSARSVGFALINSSSVHFGRQREKPAFFCGLKLELNRKENEQ